ncbi:MAG: hypothetical protein ABIQ47_07085 [Tepidiformaceae bacterium]
MSEARSNYRWLVTGRMSDAMHHQAAAPDGEALLYYQRALEAELAQVRHELTLIGLPTPPEHTNGRALGVAAHV